VKIKKWTNMTKGKNTFTPIDLMILVVIIGILANIAILMFSTAAERNKLFNKVAEAKYILKQIFTAAMEYYMENGLYPPAVTDLFDNLSIWTDVGVPISTPSSNVRFQYNVTTGGTAGFAAVAIPVGATGTSAASSTKEIADQALINKVTSVTIDQNGSITIYWK